MSLLLALFGHGAMSDLSPSSAAKRTLATRTTPLRGEASFLLEFIGQPERCFTRIKRRRPMNARQHQGCRGPCRAFPIGEGKPKDHGKWRVQGYCRHV